VKQSDLGEYEEKAAEKQMNINIQDRTQAPPLKSSNRDGKYQVWNSTWQQPKLKVSQWEKSYSPWNQSKSNQAPSSTKNAHSPWSREHKVLSNALRQTSR
jgi:hypothetical protein